MVYMLREALVTQPDVQKFAFCSESCIPVLPAAAAIDSLFAHR